MMKRQEGRIEKHTRTMQRTVRPAIQGSAVRTIFLLRWFLLLLLSSSSLHCVTFPSLFHRPPLSQPPVKGLPEAQ